MFSGRPVIDVFDLSSMEVRARVNEQERANVAVGPDGARSNPTSLPSARPTAKVSSIAGLGRPDSRSGPLRQFDVTLELRRSPIRGCGRARPCASLVAGRDGRRTSLLLPRQALFEIDGKPIVYVQSGQRRASRRAQMKVLHRTESQVAIEGLDEGAEVALVDPVARAASSAATTTAAGVRSAWTSR